MTQASPEATTPARGHSLPGMKGGLEARVEACARHEGAGEESGGGVARAPPRGIHVEHRRPDSSPLSPISHLAGRDKLGRWMRSSGRSGMPGMSDDSPTRTDSWPSPA